MKVLFVGGNGNISWHCVEASIALGYEVTILLRGATRLTRRAPNPLTKIIYCDIRNADEVTSALVDLKYDVVCDFLCYSEEHARAAYKLFKGKVGQYIFISSVVVYKRPCSSLPFKENSIKYSGSEYPYASDKLAAESYFISKFRDEGFPVTIVRPAHTYDTIIPSPLGHNCFTAVDRYLRGLPILIAGDGTNLWSLCHSADFAEGLLSLFGCTSSIGEDYHITGDEWLSWLEISSQISDVLSLDNPRVIPVPAAEVLKIQVPPSKNLAISYLGKAFKGQRMWCDIYDNTKIINVSKGWKCKIKFREGFRMTIDWLNEDPVRKRINSELDAILEDLTVRFDYLGYNLNEIF